MGWFLIIRQLWTNINFSFSSLQCFPEAQKSWKISGTLDGIKSLAGRTNHFQKGLFCWSHNVIYSWWRVLHFLIRRTDGWAAVGSLKKNSVRSFQFLKCNPYYFSTRLTWLFGFGLHTVQEAFSVLSNILLRVNKTISQFPVPMAVTFFVEGSCRLLFYLLLWVLKMHFVFPALGFPVFVCSLSAFISWPFCPQVQSAATLGKLKEFHLSPSYLLQGGQQCMGSWILSFLKDYQHEEKHFLTHAKLPKVFFLNLYAKRYGYEHKLNGEITSVTCCTVSAWSGEWVRTAWGSRLTTLSFHVLSKTPRLSSYCFHSH